MTRAPNELRPAPPSCVLSIPGDATGLVPPDGIEHDGTMAHTIPFQDLMHDNFCWGCGADNPDGLQLKSRWDAGAWRAS